MSINAATALTPCCKNFSPILQDRVSCIELMDLMTIRQSVEEMLTAQLHRSPLNTLMDVRVSSMHENIETFYASPHVGERCVPHHHSCVGRLFMRTREEEVTLEVILYEYSRRMMIPWQALTPCYKKFSPIPQNTPHPPFELPASTFIRIVLTRGSIKIGLRA